ncbi:MAG: DUF123 domain-containing protein, partial [Candidatus Latescibacteria bacterium]|nr:DUF123 domain-containing protein [Candidatus Latescibacterota bacterium]
DDVAALPIRSAQRQECQLAASVSRYASIAMKGFGSSDCSCDSHLYYRAEPPMEDVEFHRILQQFRMRAPSPSP